MIGPRVSVCPNSAQSMWSSRVLLCYWEKHTFSLWMWIRKQAVLWIAENYIVCIRDTKLRTKSTHVGGQSWENCRGWDEDSWQNCENCSQMLMPKPSLTAASLIGELIFTFWWVNHFEGHFLFLAYKSILINLSIICGISFNWLILKSEIKDQYNILA